MTRELILTPAAQLDIDASYQWYEYAELGLGKEFVKCLDLKLAAIKQNPLQFPILYRNAVRRALVSRFPFSIYYWEEDETIRVIAILHQKRSPRMRGVP